MREAIVQIWVPRPLNSLFSVNCLQLWRSTRHPIGASREEPVDEAHLIDDEKAEGQTHESGDQSQAAIEAGGANPEYQEI